MHGSEVGLSPSIPSAQSPPLRTSNSRTSRRGSPLLIEGTPESSSESQNPPVSPPPSEHGRNTEPTSDPGLSEPFQIFAVDFQAHTDEDRICEFYETSRMPFTLWLTHGFGSVELRRQADQLFFRPHKEKSTEDFLTNQTLYTEVLYFLRKQPSRQHPSFYTYIHDKLVQISVIMTYNKKYSQEEQKYFLSNAEYHAQEAMRWAHSSQDSAAIPKTRLAESFVQARCRELRCDLSTSGNKILVQRSSTRIIEDINRNLEDLRKSGSTNLDDFTNEAQHWIKHLRRSSDLP